SENLKADYTYNRKNYKEAQKFYDKYMILFNEIELYQYYNLTEIETELQFQHVGELLAKKLNYRFINSELFYHYIATKFSDLEEFRIISWLSNQQEENILTQVNQINNNQLISDKLLIKVVNNINIRKAINKVIQKITKQKAYIVAGRDATFNILPDAKIKIFLTAKFNARVNHRIK
ncbi:16370_t:CDS:2, partial [Racocetra fulgida]